MHNASLKNTEAEKAVVASVIMDGGRDGVHVFEAASRCGITASDFTDQQAARVFTTCQELATSGSPVDALTVSAKSGVSVETIMVWIDATPTSAHVEYYSQLVHELALRRRLVNACEQGAVVAADTDTGAGYAASKVEALIQQAVDATDIHTGGSVSILLDKRAAFYHECLDRGYGGLPTGLQWLDDVFGGLTGGRVYIVSGGAGCGKTTLVRNVAVDVARRGIPVAFATLELSPEELSSWMVCTEAGISMRQLDGGREPEAVARFETAAKEFSKMPITIEGGPMTASMFATWARRAVRGGAKLVCIDYMQLLQSEPSDKDTTEERRVSRASAAVLSAALSNNVPVLAIASESNAGTLRHSGQLSYDAAGHIRLTKREDGSGADVQFCKIRHGAPVDGSLSLYFSRGRLTETDPRFTTRR